MTQDMLSRLFGFLFFMAFIMTPGLSQATSYSGPAETFGPENLQEFKDSDYKPARELYQMVTDAMPVLEQVLILQKQIIPFLEAYYQDQHDYPTKRYIDIFKQVQSRPYGNYKNPYYREVYFEALGLDGHYQDYDESRFQVNGVEKDRLAITDERAIYFNVRGLKEQKPSLTSLFQLWLHELSHVDSTTSLAERDAWASRAATWLESHVTVIESNGVKFTAVTLPNKRSPEKIDLERDYTQTFKAAPSEALKNFLLIRETKTESKIYLPAYEGFQTFNDFIGQKTIDVSGVLLSVLWPTIEVTGVKKTSQGTLQIEYSQRSNNYKKESGMPGDNKYVRQSPGNLGSTLVPIYPDTKYTINVDLNTHTVETQRSYSSPFQTADFEIYRTKTVKNVVYVSVRAKIDESALILKDKTIHLNVRDIQTKQPLSVTPQSQRRLNKYEVLLHFALPKRNLELSQIVLPTVNEEGVYAERIIRPSRPAELALASPTAAGISTSLQVLDFNIQPKATDQDKVKTEIYVRTSKKIVGITLDVEHTIRGMPLDYPGGYQSHSEDIHFAGRGRKYYLSGKELKLRQHGDSTAIQFDFPEERMGQSMTGGEIRTVISRFFTLKERRTGNTITDTLDRSIHGATIHFSDGGVVKIPVEKLPKPFTLKSDSHRRQELEEISRHVERLMRATDYWNPKAPSCKKIFDSIP